MEELEQILKAQAARYRKMQPGDAVKLIYQNEFGGGHLIRSEQAFLAYLRAEYAATEKDPAAPLYENIGNGICRVNLAAVKPDELDALGKEFIRCAVEHKGTLAGFLNKLALLKRLTAEGLFAFDSQALGDYLADYAKAGYPAVSHSAVYRQAYKPAYRIVKKG